MSDQTIAARVREVVKTDLAKIWTRQEILEQVGGDGRPAVIAFIKNAVTRGELKRVTPGRYRVAELLEDGARRQKGDDGRPMVTAIEQIHGVFKAEPDRNWHRKEIKALLPLLHAQAISTSLHNLKERGAIINTSKGYYQLAAPGLKFAVEEEAPKRKYTRRDLGPAGDAIVYLTHARNAMKNHDSPEYMLVSLALYTLQGKM